MRSSHGRRLISGVSKRKVHFPSRYFSLNSATLALLGIATKLPADLTSSMPSHHDQLSKLSGTALLCTAIANFMPSLINMSFSEAIANIIAIVILIVTIVVDVSIQMSTRVIYKFLPEHAVLLLLLLLLTIILSVAAFNYGNTKEVLQRYYDYNCSLNLQAHPPPVGDSMRDKMKLFWATAHFFSPQYVFGYSEVCTAAGAMSLVVAGVVVEAVVRSAGTAFCTGTSEYRWSTTVVLFVQAVTVGVGTIAPACRWLTAVRFFPDSFTQKCRQNLFSSNVINVNFAYHDWTSTRKKRSLPVLALLGCVLILLSSPTMFACTWIRSVSIRLGRRWKKAMRIRNPRIFFPAREVQVVSTEDYFDKEDYGVSSHGEVMLVRKNLNRLPKGLNGWIQKGTKRQPTLLLELIQQHSTARDGFTTAGLFDRGGQLPDLPLPEPPACWGLPIVTLAAIAASLPGLQKESVQSLLDGMHQGFKYVTFIDKYQPSNGGGGRTNLSTRKATALAMNALYLDDQWDIYSLSEFRDHKNGRSVLKSLEQKARRGIDETVFATRPDNTTREAEELFWLNPDAPTYTYMYRVSKTILDNMEEATTDTELFALLRRMISDNMAACLTNLPSAIYNNCASGAIEHMEGKVSNAAQLLGEVENILKFLEDEEIARLYPQRRECVGEWRRRRHDHPSSSSV